MKISSEDDDLKSQEITTIESIRHFVQNKIDVVSSFDDYKDELLTLEDIKFYIQLRLDILMEKYCNNKKHLYLKK